ncbi:methyl-accepting chemotaxis protein [Ancylobacter sp. SL191]|uniref:methyl-accepting chemotaxis protein n=1 Tax=Ancylobacter sp. SL191 TaxID=2995166 RepID=UPI00226ECE51|nr:HAMP domain-containing methyl-accepting chemotaxis protein [Ancylobacter sp. SL191]WAC26306.1 HAMP domain-containing methyl-accepting chemotaxis protein [Ancylobacter sp. SL191]
MRFTNWPILGKISLVVALLGLCSTGCTLFAGWRMVEMQDDYTALIEGDAKAAVALARMNREVVWSERSIFHALASTSPEESREAEKELSHGLDELHTYATQAKAALPDYAAPIEAIVSRFDSQVKTACGPTIMTAFTATTADDKHRADKMMMVDCEPALEKVRADLATLVASLQDEMHQREEELHARADATLVELYAGTGTAILACLVLAFLIATKGIVKPIGRIVDVMDSLTSGHFETEVAETERRDEVGQLARGLARFRQELIANETLREQAALEEQRSADRLRQQKEEIAQTFEMRMGALAEAFSTSSNEVAQAATSLSAAAEETTRQARSVSDAATEASSGVQTVAASTEEMSASVREIAEQVVRAAQIADSASTDSNRIQGEIAELTQAASQIGAVIDLITSIAGQTNLLALNATIEAARAGEAGKGFAVVAQEVKELASQTAKATDEISAKVNEIQSATGRSVSSITRIATTINEIRTASAAISAAIEEQGAATREIAHSTQHAAQGTRVVNESIHGVGEAAETTGAASVQLKGLSQHLSGQAVELNKEVRSFVQTLRAA